MQSREAELRSALLAGGSARRKRLPHSAATAATKLLKTGTRLEMQMQRAFGAFAGRRPTLHQGNARCNSAQKGEALEDL